MRPRAASGHTAQCGYVPPSSCSWDTLLGTPPAPGTPSWVLLLLPWAICLLLLLGYMALLLLLGYMALLLLLV